MKLLKIFLLSLVIMTGYTNHLAGLQLPLIEMAATAFISGIVLDRSIDMFDMDNLLWGLFAFVASSKLYEKLFESCFFRDLSKKSKTTGWIHSSILILPLQLYWLIVISNILFSPITIAGMTLDRLIITFGIRNFLLGAIPTAIGGWMYLKKKRRENEFLRKITESMKLQ